MTNKPTLREQIIHGLRSQGWSRIDAEDEADARLEKGRFAPNPPYSGIVVVDEADFTRGEE